MSNGQEKNDGLSQSQLLYEPNKISVMKRRPSSHFTRDDTGHGVYDTDNVIIYLQGGGFCLDNKSCKHRCLTTPQLCTHYTKNETVGVGIISNDVTINPYFYDWVRVFFPYCTSDLYSGNRDASNDTNGMAFKGKAMFKAVVTDLISKVKMNHAKRVVLTGTSAGGGGTIANCDLLQSMLPDVHVTCVPDAASFYPDIPQFASGCISANATMIIGKRFWNATKEFGPFNWWKEVKSPVLISIALWDTFAIPVFYCGNVHNASHMEKWATALLASIKDIHTHHKNISVYIPGCVRHGLLAMDNTFASIIAGTQQYSASDTISKWNSDLKEQLGLQVWDQCNLKESAFNCNPTCLNVPEYSLLGEMGIM